jgi:hypothetical protein
VRNSRVACDLRPAGAARRLYDPVGLATMCGMRWVLVCVALGGCASAGKGNSIIGGITDAGPSGVDAREILAPDASPIDAPPEQVKLSASATETITLGNTFACRDNVNDVTLENSYYRLFLLDDYGIKPTLHVSQVDFAIELADGGFVGTDPQFSQPGTVALGVYGGAIDDAVLDMTKVRSVASADIKIADGVGTRMSVPITGDVAGGSILLVSLTVADGTKNGALFLIGSNRDGERRPGYTRAPGCSIPDPKTMAAVAKDIMHADADIILSVTGTR